MDITIEKIHDMVTGGEILGQGRVVAAFPFEDMIFVITEFGTIYRIRIPRYY